MLISFCLSMMQKILFLKKHALKVNPNCIDLFITNSPNSFQNTSTIMTELSDFHKIVIIVLKAAFTKSTSKVITYRDFKLFNEEKFKTDLKNSLRITNILSYHVFEKIFLKVLRRHAPIKNKTIRANPAPYVTKTMRKAILKRAECKIGTSVIKKFENHLSVLSIKETINIDELFQFSQITSEKILSEINNLSNKKVGSYKNIPTKILKDSSEIICEYLTKIWNEQVIMQKKLPK